MVKLLAVGGLVTANVGFAMSSGHHDVESIDWACEVVEIGKPCSCVELPLFECQLSGDPGTCADLYPGVCPVE